MVRDIPAADESFHFGTLDVRISSIRRVFIDLGAFGGRQPVDQELGGIWILRFLENTVSDQLHRDRIGKRPADGGSLALRRLHPMQDDDANRGFAGRQPGRHGRGGTAQPPIVSEQPVEETHGPAFAPNPGQCRPWLRIEPPRALTLPLGVQDIIPFLRDIRALYQVGVVADDIREHAADRCVSVEYGFLGNPQRLPVHRLEKAPRGEVAHLNRSRCNDVGVRNSRPSLGDDTSNRRPGHQAFLVIRCDEGIALLKLRHDLRPSLRLLALVERDTAFLFRAGNNLVQ